MLKKNKTKKTTKLNACLDITDLGPLKSSKLVLIVETPDKDFSSDGGSRLQP